MIVLLLTSCITLGTGLAFKTLTRVFSAAKAQTLANTLNYLISDELRTAMEPKIDAEGLNYKSENYGRNSTMKVGEVEGKNLGRIYVDNHNRPEEDGYNAAGNVYVFGAPKLYGDNLQVKKDGEDGFKIELSEDKKIFTVHYVIVDKNDPDTPLFTSDFQVRSMDG